MHKSFDFLKKISLYTVQTASSSRSLFEDNNNDISTKDPASGRNKRAGKAKDPSDNKHTPLVQTTLSSLFKKVEEKVMLDVSHLLC